MVKTEFIFDSKFNVNQVMEALQSGNRLKWDKNIASITQVQKLGKINLIHQLIKPHPLLSQKRDMFYK
jgi:hypothetical protein